MWHVIKNSLTIYQIPWLFQVYKISWQFQVFQVCGNPVEGWGMDYGLPWLAPGRTSGHTATKHYSKCENSVTTFTTNRHCASAEVKDSNDTATQGSIRTLQPKQWTPSSEADGHSHYTSATVSLPPTDRFCQGISHSEFSSVNFTQALVS